MKSQKLLNILFTCGREPAYPRNHFLLNALEEIGTVKKIANSSKCTPIRYARVALYYPSLIWKRPDLIVAGFLGQPLVPLIRSFTRKPIMFDPFVSIYDTLVNDRQTISTNSVAAKIFFSLDRWSLSLSNIILADTQAHANYFQKTFGVPIEKVRVLMVGADENLFFPRESKQDARLVLYYSSFLPLHGTETVVRAARLIQDLAPDIHFRIIGNGIEYRRIRKISDEIRLLNTDFITTVPLNELPLHITEAALCLGGHFGKSDKAKRVIAGKTFQCLAMGKATIVGENDANRELLTHGKDAWFCKMNDYESLARSILKLMEDSELRGRIGERAHQTFIEKGSYSALSTQLEGIVEELFTPKIGSV